MNQAHPLVFISYPSPDRERVIPFFERLSNHGFDVWMDSRRLKPGQNWDIEINRALEKATFVILFISQLSFDRRGYIQRELKLALDKRAEKLIDDIYLIPVLLDDDVQLPHEIKELQSIQASNPKCYELIEESMKLQLDRLGIEKEEIQNKEQLYWTSRIKREEWDGIPGYEVELQFLELRSDLYPNVSEISEFIKGDLLPILFEHRADKFSPSSERFNYGQDKTVRTNTYDAYCSDPNIVGRVISIPYAVHWYGAGAAHPNHHFKTYCFLLEPVIRIKSLEEIFSEPDTAFKIVQNEVRQRLTEIRLTNDPEDEEAKLDNDWLNEGTQTWEDFASFVFRADGVEVLFAPYQIAAYVYGSHSALISYGRIAPLMRKEFAYALQIQYAS